jgi:hypothetical protein
VFNNINNAVAAVVCEREMSLVAGRFSFIQSNFTSIYSPTNNNLPITNNWFLINVHVIMVSCVWGNTTPSIRFICQWVGRRNHEFHWSELELGWILVDTCCKDHSHSRAVVFNIFCSRYTRRKARIQSCSALRLLSTYGEYWGLSSITAASSTEGPWLNLAAHSDCGCP